MESLHYQENIILSNLPYDFPEMPPTEDDLLWEGGPCMDSHEHSLQGDLLRETLALHFANRQDVFIGVDMGVYYSTEQGQQVLEGGAIGKFRAPDFFVVLGTDARKTRKSWICWQEGKAPHLIIELLSESTAAIDKTDKKVIYQEYLRVPEYFYYESSSSELTGYYLNDGMYEPMNPLPDGNFESRQLGLILTTWEGTYHHLHKNWLRWALEDGVLLPTGAERAEQERERAEQERERAEQECERAEQERERAEQERERAEQEHNRAEQERERAEQEHNRAERLAAHLRDLGINPDDV